MTKRSACALSFVDMNVLRHFRVAALAMLVAVLAGSVHGGYPPHVPVLQPYQVVSPKGTYLLEVKPGQRYGSGPCMAVLTKRDTEEIAWKRELPFTFWQACVNDAGDVGGFGYSKGPMGGDPWAMGGDAGEFLVRILDVKGAMVYEETSRRGSTFFVGYPPLSAQQLLFDARNDRMIIRIQDVFRNYHLGEGCLVSAVVPVVDGMPADLYCETARVIPDSPLLLVQLEHMNWDTKIEGTVFGVMDDRGKLIWSVNHTNKVREEGNATYRGSVPYQILSVSRFSPPVASDPAEAAPEDPFAAPAGPSTPPAQDAKPPAPPPPEPFAQYDIYLGDTKERVTYQVLKAESERDVSWSVAEVKRIPWALPQDDEESPPKNIPPVDTGKPGEFFLLGSDKKPLDGIAAVALGPDERIHALEQKTGHVHVYDGGGKPLHVCKSGEVNRVETNYGASLTVDDQGDVFVKISKTLANSKGEPEKPNPNGGSFLHFSAKGIPDETLLAPSQAGNDEEWHAQPKSTRILITDYNPVARLVQRDGNKSQVAALTHRVDGQWLDIIGAVCFAPDGSIAVRSGSSTDASLSGWPQPFPLPPSHLPTETITLYQADGTPIRTIDFSEGADLSKIAFDGTHVVATGDFDPPNLFCYVFKASGEVVGAIRIEGLAGKERIELVPFIVDHGKAILIIDCASSRVFRYAMPK